MVFTGKLNAKAFQYLLGEFLIPFINEKFPNFHKLHMDNAPTHTSDDTTDFIFHHNINHSKSPAQSPDLNPIELVWNDMKQFLRLDVKPRNRDQMIGGIVFFWDNFVIVEYCNLKIDHLYRVRKRVIEVDGKPTGL